MRRPPPRQASDLAGLALLAEEIVRFRTKPRRSVPRASGAGGASPALGDAVPSPTDPPSGPLAAIPAADGRQATADSAGTQQGSVPPPTAAVDGAGDTSVAELVQRAQAGEPEAFGHLYDRYVDLVYRYVYYRVGSTTLAEDLVSETFLRALRRIDSFSWQGRDFAAWLVTIARNLIADHFKSSRYRLEITTEDILGAASGQMAAGPEHEVLESMTNARLLEAVKKLNPEQQECIVLRFLQGLSVGETALAMGKNEGAIKALQYRAVRTLAKLLPTDLR